MMATLARLLTTAAVFTLTAPAGAAAHGPLEGTWVGTQEGLRYGPVTLIVAGDRIVVSDSADTMVGRATWKPHGPGTKDGRLTMHVDITVSGAFDVGGRGRKATGRGKRVGSVAIGDEELRLCWAESGDPKLRPAWSDSMGRGSKSARCFNLKRVALGGAGTRASAPVVVGPPDGSAPNPPARIGRVCVAECEKELAPSAMSATKVAEVCNERCGMKPVETGVEAAARCMSACRDKNRGSALSTKVIDERCQASCYVLPTTEPAPADFECMRECRQHNQMRAVSAEQIEADCRRTCSTK